MFSIHRKQFLALKKVQIVQITPPQVLFNEKKIPPHQLSFLIPPRGHLKSVKYLDIKIVQTLVANIMLMISPLI